MELLESLRQALKKKHLFKLCQKYIYRTLLLAEGDCYGYIKVINKFKKSFKLIPDFNPSNIMTDISKRIQIDHKAKNYQEVFKSIRNQSYRRKTKIFSSYLLNKHSNVCLYF